MPTPAWSWQYNFATTPEANGLTRTSASYPVASAVTTTTTGPAAGRKVVVSGSDPSSGMVFLMSSIPALDPSVGATAEATVAVTGSGDLGFEVRFLRYAAGLCVFPSSITLDMTNPALPHAEIPTGSNAAATAFRLTVDPSGVLRVYRAAILLGSFQLAATSLPQNSFMWWGEGVMSGTLTALSGYWGGAVAP